MNYQALIDAVHSRWPERTLRFYRQKDAVTGKEGELEWQISFSKSGKGFFIGIHDSGEYWEIHGFVKGWLAAITAPHPDTAQTSPAESAPTAPPPARPE